MSSSYRSSMVRRISPHRQQGHRRLSAGSRCTCACGRRTLNPPACPAVAASPPPSLPSGSRRCDSSPLPGNSRIRCQLSVSLPATTDGSRPLLELVEPAGDVLACFLTRHGPRPSVCRRLGHLGEEAVQVPRSLGRAEGRATLASAAACLP
eukprot:751891-Hanusia_phi.AAC.1